MKRLALLVTLCCAGAAVSACGKVQAKTPGPAPALTVPEPPTRVMLPVSVEPPPSPPPTVEKPAPTVPTRPATTGTARPTPTPVATPTPTPASDVTPPVLQTSANLEEIEKKARDRVDRAQKDLNRLTREALGKDAQDQYDSAARYLRLANEALKIKNFLYASFCADKAATLAGLIK